MSNYFQDHEKSRDKLGNPTALMLHPLARLLQTKGGFIQILAMLLQGYILKQIHTYESMNLRVTYPIGCPSGWVNPDS